MVEGMTTRSPALRLRTPGPISSTTPVPSWPRMVPGRRPSMVPRMKCRSVPQMALVVRRTMASVSCSITGSATSSRRMSPMAWNTTAFMIFGLQWEWSGPPAGVGKGEGKQKGRESAALPAPGSRSGRWRPCPASAEVQQATCRWRLARHRQRQRIRRGRGWSGTGRIYIQRKELQRAMMDRGAAAPCRGRALTVSGHQSNNKKHS